MTDACPCGSGLPLEACCGAYLQGRAKPQTAEALMRSRYTAYVQQNIAYLRETLWPRYQPHFDEKVVAQWAASSHWTGLTVLETVDGGPSDREGIVLFEARFLSGGSLHTHRERSRFRKKGGRWYYVEAVQTP